jgi:hypothetical protein
MAVSFAGSSYFSPLLIEFKSPSNLSKFIFSSSPVLVLYAERYLFNIAILE